MTREDLRQRLSDLKEIRDMRWEQWKQACHEGPCEEIHRRGMQFRAAKQSIKVCRAVIEEWDKWDKLGRL